MLAGRASLPAFLGQRTEPCFQQLDVTSLGTALLAHLIVGTGVRQPLASAAGRSRAIASQLSLSAQHTCDPLRLARGVPFLVPLLGSPLIAVRDLLGEIVEKPLVRRLGRPGSHGGQSRRPFEG